MPALRFVTFRLKDTDKNMRHINPFYVQKALDARAGKVKNVSRLRNGTLLIETRNDKQTELLLKANLLSSYPVEVDRHATLNSSRCVVNTNLLDGMSDEIQFALADQSVSRAYRLIGKINERPFPLTIIFLTFEVPSLPSYIYVGYEGVSVRPYIPNPMRCFRCQNVWAHNSGVLLTLYVVSVVSLGIANHRVLLHPTHPTTEGAFLDEKAIQERRVKDGLSFLEARKKFQTYQRPGLSHMHHLFAIRKLLMPQQRPQLY
jgi:hypothetical protein